MNEAIEEDDEFKLVFSDDSEEEFSEEEEEEELNFIDDDDGKEQEEASFYRSSDNNVRMKFSNQTRNPDEVVNESEDNTTGKMICQSCLIQKTGKMLNLIRLTIILTNLKSLKIASCVLQIWKISVFNAVLYGVMHCKLNGRSIEFQYAETVLGTEFFIKLKKIEKSTMLDHSIFGYFDRCQVINDICLNTDCF